MEAPFVRGRPSPHPDSLWAAISGDDERGPRLRGDRRADVGIVGGGFLGLSTALELAGSGARVALLEAARVGWGASGRNNGQIIAGLKRDPDEVRRLLGAEPAARLLQFAGTAPDRVFELIERHRIRCDAVRKGWIQAVHSRRALPLIERRVKAWQDLGTAVALIPGDAVAARLGTEFYPAAWYDPRGGAVNPLALVRGLAAAARAVGAEIFEDSPAIGVERSGGGWRIATPGGEVHCDHALLCVNAYGAGLLQPGRGAVIPLRTAQVASAPLVRDPVGAILPGGEAASDTLRLLTSFRITPDRRLIMGGASATAGAHSARLARLLHTAAADRFPALGRIPWRFAWSGYLALTADHLPSIQRIAPGLYTASACNGRGIALSVACGEALAVLLGGGREDDCPVPIRSFRAQHSFRLRHPGVALAVLAKRVLDAIDRALGAG